MTTRTMEEGGRTKGRRRVLRAVLLALACVLSPSSFVLVFAQSQGVEIVFSPNVFRAVTVALQGPSTFYSFGNILVGSAAVANLPIVVQNDGTVGTTLALTVSNQAADLGLGPTGQPLNQHWTLSTSTSPGVDSFAVFGVFQSTAPGNGQYADPKHWVKNAARCANDQTDGPLFAGGQSGVRVPAADLPAGTDIVNLWLNLYPPTRSSNLKQKKFTVTVATGGCD